MNLKLTKKGEKYVKTLNQDDIKQIADALDSIKPIIGNREAMFEAVYSSVLERKENQSKEAED